MRTLLAGVVIKCAAALAVGCAVVAASPWFLDSFAWFALVFWGVATAAGLGLGVLLLPLRDAAPVRALARRAPAALGAIALGGVALFAYSATRSYAVSDDRHKVLIIGLDGATYDIIDPMVAAGKLPHVARMMREGARAELISVDPTISPAVWTEMATGKVRAKNGVINFRSVQSMLQAKRFFDIAHDAGKTVGMLDWLVSWPPLIDEDGKSFWVPDHTARGPEAVPRKLEFLQALVGATRNDRAATLADRATWAVDALLSGLRLSTLGNAAATVVRIGATGMDEQDKTPLLQHVALALYRDLFLALRAEYRPDLASITFYGTDSLSHKYWRYFQPSDFPGTDPADVAKYGSILPDYYEAADAAIGEILATVDANTTVLLVSDHGSQAIEGAQELRFPRLHGDALAKLLGVADKVDVTGIGNELIFTPKAGAAADAAALARVYEQFTGARVDGYDAEPFVVDRIDREGDSGDYVGVAFNLAVHLTGADAFQKTLRFPDGQSVNLAEYVAKDTPISGGHHLRGVIVATGPGVVAGTRFENASLLDVAPTVLWLLGLPVGADMDGKVLVQAFDPAWVAARPVATVASYGGFGDDLAGAEGEMTPALRARLKALGYIAD
jgi:hypothetical protein